MIDDWSEKLFRLIRVVFPFWFLQRIFTRLWKEEGCFLSVCVYISLIRPRAWTAYCILYEWYQQIHLSRDTGYIKITNEVFLFFSSSMNLIKMADRLINIFLNNSFLTHAHKHTHMNTHTHTFTQKRARARTHVKTLHKHIHFFCVMPAEMTLLCMLKNASTILDWWSPSSWRTRTIQ